MGGTHAERRGVHPPRLPGLAALPGSDEPRSGCLAGAASVSAPAAGACHTTARWPLSRVPHLDRRVQVTFSIKNAGIKAGLPNLWLARTVSAGARPTAHGMPSSGPRACTRTQGESAGPSVHACQPAACMRRCGPASCCALQCMGTQRRCVEAGRTCCWARLHGDHGVPEQGGVGRLQGPPSRSRWGWKPTRRRE